MYACHYIKLHIFLQVKRTPLQLASYGGHTDVVELLLTVPSIDVNKAGMVINLIPSLPHVVVVYEWIVFVVIYLT